MSNPPIVSPAPYVSTTAIDFADASGNAQSVSAANPLPVTVLGGGSASSLADQSVVDAAGAYWLVRDNGTALSYLTWATGLAGTPTGIVAPAGKLMLDEGAVRALHNGKSLLPTGIVEVAGSFDKGDSVAVLAPSGAEIARGIVSYSADDIRQIRGRASKDIEAILGYTSGDEVIHRDDMAVG